MTPTPPSTTTSTSGQSPDTQFRVVRKRNRVPLSCGPCRHRKLKCNRGHPCDNCTKRGDLSSCTYAAPGGRKKNQANSNQSSSPDEMQNRIDRLEGLVLSLMTNGQASAGPAAAAAAIAGSVSGSSPAGGAPTAELEDASIHEMDGEEDEVEQVAKSMGVMKVDQNKSVFISDQHWYAILGEISEVKNYFNDHKKQYEDQLRRFKAIRSEDKPGTAYMFGGKTGETEDDVRSVFPQKHICDKLITRYFNSYDPALHVIHGPTFQQQYDQHWATPNETPVIWLGLVFVMMCIALQSYQRKSDEPAEFRGQTSTLADEYRRHAACALRLQDLLMSTTTMIDTLLLYVKAELYRSKDAETAVLMVVSILVRLATKMGYHRDSAPYPNIVPFQAEMRRRTWTAIRQCDLIVASQSGCPPIIRPGDTNTALPLNIYDDELHENMKALPPSRAPTEATPVSFLNWKGAFMNLYGEIVEETQTLKCAPYEHIMRLDQRLREVHAEIPPHLRIRTMQESLRDSADLIMQRLVLEQVYLKCLCSLHRKFIRLSRHNPRFSYSRRACIDASLELLQHHATLKREIGPGGRLYSVNWSITSLTAQDYLIAAMVVCLDLHHTCEAERLGKPSTNDVYAWPQERREAMIAAIEQSVAIWAGLRDTSMDAFKAHMTLSAMLDKLKAHQAARQSQGFGNMAINGGFSSGVEDTEHSAAMTLGMMSTGGMTPNGPGMFETKPSYPASMGNILNDPTPMSTGLSPSFSGGDTSGVSAADSPFAMFGGGNLGLQSMDMSSSNIDWDAWDSYVQGPSMDAANQVWPMNMDPLPNGSLNGSGQQSMGNSPSSQQSQPQPQATNNFGNGGVFMGVNTPPRNGMM